MNCRECRPLLPLFLDGELEARQMREVALHSTRCVECEGELRGMERLQELVANDVAAMVDEIDLGQVWAGVSARLTPTSRPLRERLSDWWEEANPLRYAWMPVSAAAVAAVLALLLWQTPSTTPSAQVAGVDNSAIVETVQSDGNAIAFHRDSLTNTTVLWVTDNGPPPLQELGELEDLE